MAQQARPKVAGQTLFRLAHFTRSSMRPVRKLCCRSSNPIGQAASPGVFDALMRVIVDSDVRLGRPVCKVFDGPQVRAPFEIRYRKDTKTTAAKTITSMRPNVAIWWNTTAQG